MPGPPHAEPTSNVITHKRSAFTNHLDKAVAVEHVIPNQPLGLPVALFPEQHGRVGIEHFDDPARGVIRQWRKRSQPRRTRSGRHTGHVYESLIPVCKARQKLPNCRALDLMDILDQRGGQLKGVLFVYVTHVANSLKVPFSWVEHKTNPEISRFTP